MRTPLHLILAGALLGASPIAFAAPALAADDDTQAAPPSSGPEGELTQAQVFSAVAGKIVGAASACDSIPRERVSAAAKQASDIVTATVEDDDELAGAQALFNDAAKVGKDAVPKGGADCDVVETSLSKLEQIRHQ